MRYLGAGDKPRAMIGRNPLPKIGFRCYLFLIATGGTAMKRSAFMKFKGGGARQHPAVEAPWPMTFVGGVMGEEDAALSASDVSSSLAKAAAGDRLTIRAIKGHQQTVQQLQRLGLRLGQAVTVLSCAESGSVIVAGPQGHVGLGAAIARQVLVTPIAVTQPKTAVQPLSMASPSILPTS